jgi:hypothetical protein
VEVLVDLDFELFLCLAGDVIPAFLVKEEEGGHGGGDDFAKLAQFPHELRHLGAEGQCEYEGLLVVLVAEHAPHPHLLQKLPVLRKGCLRVLARVVLHAPAQLGVLHAAEKGVHE